MAAEHKLYPLGEPGQMATYQHESEGSLPNTVVKTLTVAIGSVEEKAGVPYQWICLRATKISGEKFAVWLLSESVPSADLKVSRATTYRYILQIGDDTPLEFRDRFTGEPVLPGLGAWQYLFPRSVDKTVQSNFFPQTVKYLGHTYRLARISDSTESDAPPDTELLSLRPDALIGPPSNTRQVDETRRYDMSDYEIKPLTEADYDEMIAAGINCVRVDEEQVEWVKNRNVFYWGIDAATLGYPECLYIDLRVYPIQPNLMHPPAQNSFLSVPMLSSDHPATRGRWTKPVAMTCLIMRLNR